MLTQTPRTYEKASITFNSGILQALKEAHGTITGNASPVIPYGNRTVGYGRFYRAAEVGVKVDAVVAVPISAPLRGVKLVETRDYETGETRIYKVSQIQLKEDSAPPCAYLTLTETEVRYDDQREVGDSLKDL